MGEGRGWGMEGHGFPLTWYRRPSGEKCCRFRSYMRASSVPMEAWVGWRQRERSRAPARARKEARLLVRRADDGRGGGWTSVWFACCCGWRGAMVKAASTRAVSLPVYVWCGRGGLENVCGGGDEGAKGMKGPSLSQTFVWLRGFLSQCNVYSFDVLLLTLTMKSTRLFCR